MLVPHCLDYYSYWVLKLISESPSLFFFFKIISAILDLLPFQCCNTLWYSYRRQVVFHLVHKCWLFLYHRLLRNQPSLVSKLNCRRSWFFPTSWACVLIHIKTLWDPTDCSPPGSSVHGIFQARVLKSVAIFSSRGSSWPRYQTCLSCISHIGRHILYHWATWEAQFLISQQHLIRVDQLYLHLCSYYKEKKLFTKFSPIIESLFYHVKFI